MTAHPTTPKSALSADPPRETMSRFGGRYVWRTAVQGAITAGYRCERCGGGRRLSVFTAGKPEVAEAMWWAGRRFYCSRQCWSSDSQDLDRSAGGAVSTQTYTPTTSRAYQLSRAITDMAGRFGSSSRNGAYAFARVLDGGGDEARAEMERLERAADRQFRALQRLTAALRDLPSNNQ